MRLFLISLLTLWSCGQKSNEHDSHAQAGEAVDNPGNEALYHEVMKVHDEVMPKMNDIYNLKQELAEKLADSSRLADDRKKEIDAVISKLDSANDGMMVWMRQFDPIPDSLGEQKAREYLEIEMEKVKKVREDILQALASAQEVNAK
jgi:hypothetical protein